jgi:hypothetical protein
MQKWSKLQLQNKKLNGKIFLLIIFTGLFFAPPQIFAQDEERDIGLWQHFTVEERKERIDEVVEIPWNNHKITLEVGKHSGVKVTHAIETGFFGNGDPRMIKILPGEHSNLYVTDKDDDSYPFFWEDETFEKSEYVILQSKLSQYDLFITYDLENYMEIANDGLWVKKIELPTDVEILFEDDLNTVYINSRPIDISNADGIKCVGCNMNMEYFDNEVQMIKKILVGNYENQVKIVSTGKILNFEFNEQINGIYFETEKNNQLITLDIPLNLILYPFSVYLTNDNDSILDQEDKIRKTEILHNENSVILSIKPENIGKISIIGATQNEYQDALSKINERDERTTADFDSESTEIQEVIEVDDTALAFENWKKSSPNNSNNNIIFGIVVAISAIIIVGIIIKLKK